MKQFSESLNYKSFLTKIKSRTKSVITERFNLERENNSTRPTQDRHNFIENATVLPETRKSDDDILNELDPKFYTQTFDPTRYILVSTATGSLHMMHMNNTEYLYQLGPPSSEK